MPFIDRSLPRGDREDFEDDDELLEDSPVVEEETKTEDAE